MDLSKIHHIAIIVSDYEVARYLCVFRTHQGLTIRKYIL